MKYYNKFKGLLQIDEYDAKTSLSLAIACDLAYEEDIDLISSTVKSWSFDFINFKSVVKQPDIDTQYYIMSKGDDVVVVFRGSESLKDWFANFQAVYDPGPLANTKAHEGFQDALFPAVINLTKVLDLVIDENTKIWLTGHSLGGALCSLFAGMLIENEYNVYGIYTYASPRPGNGDFEQELNKKVFGPHYRVVNSGDIVPHLPPEPFYSHPGKRIILKDEIIENTSDSWFSQRIDALKFFIENTANKFDVADNHRLSADNESYIPRLIKDLERA